MRAGRYRWAQTAHGPSLGGTRKGQSLRVLAASRGVGGPRNLWVRFDLDGHEACVPWRAVGALPSIDRWDGPEPY